jgi:hypothetical protein
MQDTGFVAVHIIHGSNTSYAYPQQLLLLAGVVEKCASNEDIS